MENKGKRNPFIAPLLTFFLNGLGQVYNGQWYKGVIFYFFDYVLSVACYFVFFRSFTAIVIALALAVCCKLVFIADASISAMRIKSFEPRAYNKWYVYLAIYLVSLFFVAPVSLKLFLSFSPARSFYIPATSMRPTLEKIDYVITDRWYYLNRSPERGDIIIFEPPPSANAQGKKFIKRIVAMEAESVEVKEGKVYINDKPLNEPYAPEPVSYDMERVIVPAGCLFVLGDNRNNSDDSHIWGFLNKENVYAKALYIYWPPARWGRSI